MTLLATVLKIAFEDVAGDLTCDVYRRGNSLGENYKYRFRAKFLLQFGLFFRYQQSVDAKVIVLASVNEDSTLRPYESPNDAYAVFKKMLDHGNLPDWLPSWNYARQLDEVGLGPGAYSEFG